MYFACRGPASTSSTSTIVSVLVIFGHGSSRRGLRTFLPLHLTIVRVSICFFRFVSAAFSILNTLPNNDPLIACRLGLKTHEMNFTTLAFALPHESFCVYPILTPSHFPL